MGAAAGGAAHAVVADVREETAVYIAGRPYLRRELEMPVTALHHAGGRPPPAAALRPHPPT